MDLGSVDSRVVCIVVDVLDANRPGTPAMSSYEGEDCVARQMHSLKQNALHATADENLDILHVSVVDVSVGYIRPVSGLLVDPPTVHEQ